MKLGKQLIINRAKHKDAEWASRLTGRNKEAHEFFKATLDEIREDIEGGYIVNSICMPSSLDYEKNIGGDGKFWEVVNRFTIALEKEGLRAIIEKMPPNDINRYGDSDHYIHINPIL